MGLFKEAIQLATETLEFCKKLKGAARQAWCLSLLAQLFLNIDRIELSQKKPHPAPSPPS